MKRQQGIAVLVVVLGLLTTAVPILAQVSANYDLRWHVIGAGRGERTSASFKAQDTAGQPVVDRSQSTAVELIAGFWAGARPPFVGHRLYLPLVVKQRGP